MAKKVSGSNDDKCVSLHAKIWVGKINYAMLLEGFDVSLRSIQPSHVSPVF